MTKHIIIVGGRNYGYPFLKMNRDVTTNVKYMLTEPESIDLVLFTGGEDVHPNFYGGVDCGISYTNLKRDSYEMALLDFCMKHKIKMTGICRGFQFLNVMAGGKMYQDIDNHGVYRHPAYFRSTGEIYKVSSTHHQLVILPSSAIPMVWADPKRSNYYNGPDGLIDVNGPSKEIEGAIFPNLNAFGVQYHPEIMAEDEKGRIEYENLILKFIEEGLESIYHDRRQMNAEGRIEP